MANRTFIDKNYSIVKRMVELYCTFTVTEGTAVTTLQKWNYPVFGTGPTARTYTAATSASTLPSGSPYPLQYGAGSEGVLDVTRTGIGKYTFRLQDNYQRVLFLAGHAAGASGTPVFAIATENTTVTNLGSTAGTGIIGVAFWDFAAAAVDPIGSVRMKFTLADATEP